MKYIMELNDYRYIQVKVEDDEVMIVVDGNDISMSVQDFSHVVTWFQAVNK